MYSAAVANNRPTHVSLFPFPPCACLAEVEDTLGLRSGRDGFIGDNVRKLLACRAGAMVGEIDVEAVEVDIADADSE
jgi:hypothetical protein